jgi:hypothetical protein
LHLTGGDVVGFVVGNVRPRETNVALVSGLERHHLQPNAAICYLARELDKLGVTGSSPVPST